MNSVVATVASTLMACARASAEWSPTVLPEPVGFCLGMAPVRARIASRSVVLPLAKGPTMAMHFGPVRLPPARLPISLTSSSLILRRRPASAAVAAPKVSLRRRDIVTRVGGEGKGERDIGAFASWRHYWKMRANTLRATAVGRMRPIADSKPPE